MYGSPCREAVRTGQVLAGRYRVSRELAAGGMGQLFEGMDQSSKTPIVIKVPRPDVSGQCANCARLAEEGQSAALLEDEHIVRLLHAGTLDSGLPFLVMERLEGTDLNAIMQARGAPLPVGVAVRYVRQACSGLVAMHGAGLVHRDLKPSNLFLCTRGGGSPLIKVIDFGLAKPLQGRASDIQLTGAHILVGSPSYASPEQIQQFDDVDRRTDVWSLGVVLFELLTGGRPFAGTNVMDVCSQILMAPVPDPRELRPELDPRLAAVVRRCLAKARQDRYDSVAELCEALAPFDETVSPPLRFASDGPRGLASSSPSNEGFQGFFGKLLERSASRARLGLAALVLAAMTLLVVVGMNALWAARLAGAIAAVPCARAQDLAGAFSWTTTPAAPIRYAGLR